MATLKTAPSSASVDEFLATVADGTRRRDAVACRDLLRRVTGEPPTMWGPAIVGFAPARGTAHSVVVMSTFPTTELSTALCAAAVAANE